MMNLEFEGGALRNNNYDNNNPTSENQKILMGIN